MRVVLFTLMSIACTAALSATVYKWVDENGVTHYSDQPHENAEKVQVAQPQTYKAPRVSAPAAAPPAPQARPPNSYLSCDVVMPANDQTLPNADSVSTAVQVNPVPRDGDQVFLLLDGQRVPNFPASGGSYTISPIDRGTHSLQAVVQDNSGKTLCQSASVSFTVLQPSVLNPANPNFKR
jgi:Domain of unknown function (DUF4124)